MTRTLRSAANAGGVLLILAGAVLAAFRMPYVLAVLTGGAGLALLLGMEAFLLQRAGAALDALARASGTNATEAVQTEAEAAAWIRGYGIPSLSRTKIRRVRRKSVPVPGGTVHLVRVHAGDGKPKAYDAVLLCAPASGTTASSDGGEQDLLRRARELGAGRDTEIGTGEQGACLYAAGPPAELLAPDAAREILASLAMLGRR